MAKVLFQCQVTDEDVLRTWRGYLGDPDAPLPAAIAEIPASFVVAAMEDAALAMVQVLLVDKALG